MSGKTLRESMQNYFSLDIILILLIRVQNKEKNEYTK